MSSVAVCAAAGPPVDVTTSARRLGEIVVTFNPTPIFMRNGIVTGYVILLDGVRQEPPVDPGLGMLSRTLENLIPGRTYGIRVAAINGAGVGDSSREVLQTTISLPPTQPPLPPPPENRQVTQMTVPFTLPSIADLSSYRYALTQHGRGGHNLANCKRNYVVKTWPVDDQSVGLNHSLFNAKGIPSWPFRQQRISTILQLHKAITYQIWRSWPISWLESLPVFILLLQDFCIFFQTPQNAS